MRRLMLDMGQTNIADALGLTFQQVQKYEKGSNRISASRLQHLSQILQVPVPFFFEGAPAASAGRVAKTPADDPPYSYVADFLATSDGLALVKAFMRIEDARLRRAICPSPLRPARSRPAPRSASGHYGPLGIFASGARASLIELDNQSGHAADCGV